MSEEQAIAIKVATGALRTIADQREHEQGENSISDNERRAQAILGQFATNYDALRQQLAEMRVALSLATDFIREEGEMGSLSDEKWRALIVDRLSAKLVPQNRGANLNKACDCKGETDLAPHQPWCAALAPTSQPSRGKCETQDVSKLLADIDEAVAYFEKEALYETENMGAGGSQIALGRWRRFIAAIWEARCFVAEHGPNWRSLKADCVQPSLSAQIESASKALKETPERYKQPETLSQSMAARGIKARVKPQFDDDEQPDTEEVCLVPNNEERARIVAALKPERQVRCEPNTDTEPRYNDEWDGMTVRPSPPQDDIVAGLREMLADNRMLWAEERALLDRAIAALGEKGWIPVGERMPEDCHHVLMLFDDSYGGSYQIGWCEGEKWYANDAVSSEWHGVTHWHYLPSPPVAEDK